MITLNASGGSITFTFSGNSTYLNDGVITCPVNSLALIIDESDMVTFKKSQSSDIFVSANIAEFGMTKAELESWFKENAVGSTGGGGGDITSGEVQTMIDESISGKADSSDVYTTGQTSGATEIANALNAKLDTTAYTPTDLSEYWTSAQTQSAITQATSGKADTSYVDSSVSGKADADSLSAYTINEGIASSSQTYDVEVTNDPPVNVYTLDKPYEGIFFNLELNYANRYLIGYDENDTEIGRFYINAQPGYSPTITIDTTGFTDVAIYKTILNSSAATVVIEGNEISAIKKFNFYEQYWATDTATTVYFYNNGYNVTDAFKYDLKKLEGGNSISIEKTASAYIISASLPLSAGTGLYSIIEGQGTTASGNASHAEGFSTYAIGQGSHAEGNQTSAMTSYSHVEGRHTIANNDFEHASGLYNISSSGSSSFGDSGNTLFSVGNGNYGGPRHNAFEIRQNGDIYIADTSSTGEFYEKSMIKLQDNLGGGGSSYSAGTGIDITNDVISVTGMVATSAVTSAVTSGSTDVLTSGGAYEQFGGLKIVKLTESEYAALVTKDPDVLYVVIPDPSNP